MEASPASRGLLAATLGGLFGALSFGGFGVALGFVWAASASTATDDAVATAVGVSFLLVVFGIGFGTWAGLRRRHTAAAVTGLVGALLVVALLLLATVIQAMLPDVVPVQDEVVGGLLVATIPLAGLGARLLVVAALRRGAAGAGRRDASS